MNLTSRGQTKYKQTTEDENQIM